MSLSRQFFREMRPFFRMLDDVSFGRQAPYYPAMLRMEPIQDMLSTQPAIDVADEGNQYTVEADLPGMSKDNLQVRIGDNGRSVTIEGKVTEGSQGPKPSSTTNNSSEDSTVEENTTSKAASKSDGQSTQLSTERQFTRNVQFTRTIWLPRPVDTQNVRAKMKDGVLSLTLKKAADKEGTYITVEVS